MALLDIRNLHVYYGKIHALRGVSLAVGENQIVTLIGANGAGKSTTLRAISGILAAAEGEVVYDGMPLSALPAHQIVARGVVQVPEGRRIFSRLTVSENLRIGAFLSNDKEFITRTEEMVLKMFPVLKRRFGQVAGTLSGGEQQMLAIGRALMSNPRVLLLDEPSEGLAPQIVAEVMATIRRLKEQGLSILLVEQNAKLAFDIADDIVILNSGRVVVDATAAALARDKVDLHQHLGVY